VSETVADRGKDRALGAKGEATRQRLMDAAEEIFGTKGFYHTSVGDITAKAGVAQGTFYLYFPTKVDIFRALVEHLSHVLRTETEVATQGARDRLEAERLGIDAFFKFVHRHRNLYRIVRQAEFVDEALYKWYYERMARGYARKLQDAMQRGEIRTMDPDLLAWCLMGISDYTGMRYILWKDENQADAAKLLDFLTAGLAPEKG
jgi:AcrR family transcriptional regulator